MTRPCRAALALAASVALSCTVVLPPRPAAAAAQIKSQSPCAVAAGRECFNFGVGIGSSPLELRSFSYTAPSRGTAEVTFHGSLLCANENTSAFKVVDIDSQILASTSEVPRADQPGGMRLAAVVYPSTSQTFNLASTRVVSYGSAGTKTFRFRVIARRVDAGINCYIYNAAFSVSFVP